MDKKYTYKLDDFLNDHSFVYWVRYDQLNSENPWSQWLNKHPDKKEIFNEAIAILESLKFQEPVPDKILEDRIWNKIEKEIDSGIPAQQSQGKIFHLGKLWPLVAVAASVLLILYFQLKPELNKISAMPGESLVHQLPDGSIIQLNAGSQISYVSKQFAESRKIKLKGEAFFDVEKGNLFSVKTNKGLIEVVGTSFNVSSWNDGMEVEVYSGKVMVSEPGRNRSFILIANEKVILDSNNNFTKSQFQNRSKSDWLEGFSSFDNAELSAVFDEVERQFDVKVLADKEILSRNFNGVFKNSNLDSALLSVCWPMNLQYEKLNGKVIISIAE